MFTRNMGMNLTYKPFSDKRVRQAINHAIDTDLIIKRLVRDKAYRAVGWLPTTSPAFDATMKPYAFDPEKAKKLLARQAIRMGLNSNGPPARMKAGACRLSKPSSRCSPGSASR